MSQASAATLGFLRRRRRVHRSPQQRSDRFTGLYTVGLYTAIGAWVSVQALRQSPTRGGSATWLAGRNERTSSRHRFHAGSVASSR